MSNRSSLSFPSQTSGSIGSAVSALQATSSQSISTAVITELASVEVPAGVYSVSFCANIQVLDATTIDDLFVYVGTSSAGESEYTTLVSSQNSYPEETTTSTITKQVYYNTTIVLTESSVIYALVGGQFSGAGVNCITPENISPVANIQAIKLA